ncbi:MAG: polymer-forming cytoskeletal protein [Acetatifactor sp.]|nr:polymer-forming cytoskeletal protein [Acetatifactor sp.]
MFGKKKIKIGAILGKGVDCNGDFNSKESARIDGTVNGNVIVEGTVIVGESGVVNGYIKAQTVIAGGKVYGDITAPERIELAPSAYVIGNITTKVLVVDDGAVFQGKCDMGQTFAVKEEVEIAPETTPVQEEKPKEAAVESEPAPEQNPGKKQKKSAKSAFVKAMKEMKESGSSAEAAENGTSEQS